jgi:uncharacterized C2H2 Zn-finger protein
MLRMTRPELEAAALTHQCPCCKRKDFHRAADVKAHVTKAHLVTSRGYKWLCLAKEK